MRKLSKLLFAAALAATAFFSLPPKALAVNPSPLCQHCDIYGDCFSCCRCDGGSVASCARLCS